MICERAYYPNGTGEHRERLFCECQEVKNGFSKGKCPLVYWCNVSERFENTPEFFDCIYRKETTDHE